MTFHIRLDAQAIQVLTQLASQHVQDPAPLGIGAGVELLVRVCISPEKDRGLSIVPVGQALGIIVLVVQEFIASQQVTAVEVFVVCGEPLVEPEIGPVLARDIVAEPLVYQFMRHQSGTGFQGFHEGRVQGPVRENCERGVFHAACHKVVRCHLVVLIPGVGHPDFLLEEAHHVGRVLE